MYAPILPGGASIASAGVIGNKMSSTLETLRQEQGKKAWTRFGGKDTEPGSYGDIADKAKTAATNADILKSSQDLIAKVGGRQNELKHEDVKRAMENLGTSNIVRNGLNSDGIKKLDELIDLIKKGGLTLDQSAEFYALIEKGAKIDIDGSGRDYGDVNNMKRHVHKPGQSAGGSGTQPSGGANATPQPVSVSFKGDAGTQIDGLKINIEYDQNNNPINISTYDNRVLSEEEKNGTAKTEFIESFAAQLELRYQSDDRFKSNPEKFAKDHAKLAADKIFK